MIAVATIVGLLVALHVWAHLRFRRAMRKFNDALAEAFEREKNG